MRDFVLRGAVAMGACALLITELLSPFHLLRRGPLAAAWILVLTAAAIRIYRRPPAFSRPSIRPFEAGIAAIIAALAVPIGLTAWLSAPNSYDALAYHMPRVVYWAQSGSVEFFPTSYFTQISLPPLAEYFMLHSYVLTGGDRFVNLVAFAAFLGCVAGVSSIASAFGGGPRAQALAAFFCATLPNAILQASGAKNESMLALWLVCMVYFAARREAAFTGLAFGLALATKSTAYLFAPPLLAAVVLAQWLGGRRPRWTALAVSLAAGALLLNTPQYLRNIRFSGSPLGYDSPYGSGGPYRWANARLGWKPAVSNLLRNLSDQLGGRSARWNEAVYDGAIGLHRFLHIDPDDPDSTWALTHFPPPMSTAHEGSANNRWHLALLCVAAAFAFRIARKKRDFIWLLHASALSVAFLLFCWYVKWEPAGARFLLPLFILGSPPAGALLASIRPAWATVLACLFLLDGARLPALKNWTRPLAGPHSVLSCPRDESYFSELIALHNQGWYRRAVDLTARSGCGTVGLDVAGDQAEYPFQALLRLRNPAARFLHTGVENASARYHPANPPRACAVLCMSCGERPERIARYRSIGPPIELGGFVLFLAPRP